MKKYYILPALFLLAAFSFELKAEIKKGKWEFVKEDEYCFIQSIPIKTEIPKGKKRGENYILVYKINYSTLQSVGKVTLFT